MKRKLLVFLILFFLFAKNVFAGNDISITCDSISCTKPTVPLFDEHNILPGNLSKQTLSVTNARLKDCELSFDGVNSTPVSALLSEKITISITNGGITWYAGTLKEITSTGYHSLGVISPGPEYKYLWTAVFDKDSGNEYQNLITKFDLNFNFRCEDETSPSPTPTPTFTPTPTPTSTLNPPSGVYLNELMADPPDNQEWVEVYNSNNFPIILSGWNVDDIEGSGGSPKPLTAGLNVVNIPAFGFHVVEVGGSYYNNGGDSARLINNEGVQVDIFSYTYSHDNLSWSRQSGGSWCEALLTKNYLNNLCYGITPTPTQTPSSDGGGNPSNPSGGGGSVPAPVCTDTAPQSAPRNLLAVAGVNNVRLTWDEADGPLTYYLVAFGTEPGVMLYGNPNIGGPGTTSYLVEGLSAGTRYYFKVRAGNGCMPGPFSNEASTIPTGAVIGGGILPSGFQPGVLGKTTENGEVNGGTSSVSGTAVEGAKTGSVCPYPRWWIVLIIQALITLIYCLYVWSRKRKKSYLLLAFICLTSIIFAILCLFFNSWICCYWPWVALILAICEIVIFVFRDKDIKEEEKKDKE